MATDGKEVRLAVYRIKTEQSGPDFREDGFGLSARRLCRARRHCQTCKSAAVEFAVGSSRQRVQTDQPGWDHVGWQAPFEGRSQLLRVQPGVGCDIADKVLLRPDARDDDGGVLYPDIFSQGDLDFFEFDPEAAQFDLLIPATEVIERSICAPAGDISRCIIALCEAVDFQIDKSGLGKIRLAEISGTDTDSADKEFARLAGRDRRTVGIKKKDTDSVDWTAERHARRIRSRVKRACHSDVCAFRRAVTVQHCCRAG